MSCEREYMYLSEKKCNHDWEKVYQYEEERDSRPLDVFTPTVKIRKTVHIMKCKLCKEVDAI